MTPEYEMWKAKYDREVRMQRWQAEGDAAFAQALYDAAKRQLEIWDQMQRERDQRLHDWIFHRPPWWDLVSWIKRWMNGAPT